MKFNSCQQNADEVSELFVQLFLKRFEIVLPRSTLQDHMKFGELNWHTNAVRPSHTEKNLVQRVDYCLNQILLQTIHTAPKFCSMFHSIHVDEILFYIIQECERMLLEMSIGII